MGDLCESCGLKIVYYYLSSVVIVLEIYLMLVIFLLYTPVCPQHNLFT